MGWVIIVNREVFQPTSINFVNGLSKLQYILSNIVCPCVHSIFVMWKPYQFRQPWKQWARRTDIWFDPKIDARRWCQKLIPKRFLCAFVHRSWKKGPSCILFLFCLLLFSWNCLKMNCSQISQRNNHLHVVYVRYS